MALSSFPHPTPPQQRDRPSTHMGLVSPGILQGTPRWSSLVSLGLVLYARS